MFTIDLLKGQGVPIKSRRGGTMLIVVSLAIPMLIAVGLYAQYMVNSIKTETLKNSLVDCEKKIAACDHIVAVRGDLEKQLETMKSCRKDLVSVVKNNEQWSGILKTVVDSLPPSMVLRKIDVKVAKKTKAEPDPVDPNKMKNNNYIVRTMQLSILSNNHVDSAPAIKAYIKALSESEKLEPRVDDIRISAQEVAKINSAEMKQYDIDCVFKAQAE